MRLAGASRTPLRPRLGGFGPRLPSPPSSLLARRGSCDGPPHSAHSAPVRPCGAPQGGLLGPPRGRRAGVRLRVSPPYATPGRAAWRPAPVRPARPPQGGRPARRAILAVLAPPPPHGGRGVCGGCGSHASVLPAEAAVMPLAARPGGQGDPPRGPGSRPASRCESGPVGPPPPFRPLRPSASAGGPLWGPPVGGPAFSRCGPWGALGRRASPADPGRRGPSGPVPEPLPYDRLCRVPSRGGTRGPSSTPCGSPRIVAGFLTLLRSVCTATASCGLRVVAWVQPEP